MIETHEVGTPRRRPLVSPLPHDDVIGTIARVCHEGNRAFCIATHDHSQVAWDDAPAWQRESAIAGVTGILDGSITTPEESHISWFTEKVRTGWKYGPTKNAETKEHPCMVHYAELPASQRMKDHIFHGIVHAMARGLND